MFIFSKKFFSLYWTQFFGALNDNFFKNALITLIAYKSIEVFGLQSSALVALASGVFILPFFLFSSFAGQICDRYEKSQLVRLIKVWELLIMLIACLGFYFQRYDLLLVVLFLMGLQSTFFGPIKYSVLPEIVNKDELTKANAYVQMGTFIAILIGTIAGVVSARGETSNSVIMAGLIGFALVGLLTSLKFQKLPLANKDLKIDVNVFRSTYQILKLCYNKQSVFKSLLGISTFWFVGAGILTVLPVYCKDTLQSSELVLMGALSLFTIGVAIGSMACEKLSKFRVELGVVPWASLFMSLALMLIGVLDYNGFNAGESLHSLDDFFQFNNSIAVTILLFIIPFLGGLFTVPLYTLVQEKTETAVRSRIIAGNNILNALFMVICSLGIMILFSLGVKPEHVLFILGALNLIVAVYSYYMIPEFALRFLCWAFTKVFFRAKVMGLEKLPKKGPAIVISNHVSFVDWLIIAGLVPRPIRFVMHRAYWDVPVFGLICRHGKVIPIAGHYEDKQTKISAINSIYEELEIGQVICIFPEGGISKNGSLGAFKKGVELFAKEKAVPVYPMALLGLWGSLFSRKKGRIKNLIPFVGNQKVRLVIGDPVGPTEVSREVLKQEVEKLAEEYK